MNDETPPEQTPTRVLSYNVLYHLNRPDEYSWENRRDAVAETIASQHPDIVCLQEVWRDQLTDLQERLPDYEWIGPPDGNEHTVIAYRPDRYTVVTEEFRWLSEPDADPGTPGWDGPYQKRFTFVTFRDTWTDTEFVVFSVHLHSEGAVAQPEGMKLLRQTLTEVSSDEPAILVGDYNVEPGSEVYELGRKSRDEFRDLVYASDIAETVDGPEATFTSIDEDDASEDEDESNIDHALVTPDLTVERFETVVPESESEEFRPSDHRPIVVDVSFPS